MASLDDFKTIELEDKPFFDAYYKAYPPVHSGEVFTTMVSWAEYVHYQYAFIHEHLVLMSTLKDKTVLHQPFGEFDLDFYRELMSFAEDQNAVFGFIKSAEKVVLKKHFPSLTFIDHRDFFDYVYTTSDLALLPGTRYGKIRNRLNKFMKNYHYQIEEISSKNMDEVRLFLKRWCLWKDCASDELLENERKALLFAMAHFKELGLLGIALRIEGPIEAIAVCEQMNADTLVVHFEKGSPDYDGVYKAINKETAEHFVNKVRFINRQEDAGVPGLRQAKMSYHPHHFVEISQIEKGKS